MDREAEYAVDCAQGSGTAVLRGVMRLDHDEAQVRLLAVLKKALESSAREPFTIDVREVVFMNSSAFRALAALVLEAKRTRRRVEIVGRSSVPWQERTLASLSPLYEGVEIRMTPKAVDLTLVRDGELWALTTPAGKTHRFKDSKGFLYLEKLVSQPEQELHVLELVGVSAGGDAGPVLDSRAKAEYKERLDEIRRDLDEAERNRDSARGERLRQELEALAGQLAQAVGLGGRDRRAASEAERARVNVQRCLKEVLERISKADPGLGRYLTTTVKTGTFCSFRPLK